MLILSLADLKQSIASWRLWTLLGWLEIRQRYARSRLGPFWLTISMGVMISSLGVVYGTLFEQKLSEYLPYLASSIVLWGLFSQTVQDGSVAYINTWIRGHSARDARCQAGPAICHGIRSSGARIVAQIVFD